MECYQVRARNTAPDSENRIHDDRTAAAYGFRAGLVPGFTVYGYLTVPLVRKFGTAWLERGGMHVRFMQPVYHGDNVLVMLAENAVTARREDGTVCAAGEIVWPQAEAPDPASYPEQALPEERPPASAASLVPGSILGTVRSTLALPDHAFLAQQDEPLPVYREGLLHPAALLSLCNQVLLQNVKLGPWIHLESDLRHFSLARNCDRLAARGRVVDCFERKGHRFVVLDILIIAAGDRLIQHVRHTAIYEPRRPQPAVPL